MATASKQIHSSESVEQQNGHVVSTYTTEAYHAVDASAVALDGHLEGNVQSNKFAPALPQEIITEILKYVGNTDVNTALNCRLVGPAWKEAFDECSELMGKFVFDIPHVITFLDSTIVSKVKAVCFTKALKGRREDLLYFFKEIGENIEHVTFKFHSDVTEEQFNKIKFMFSAIMIHSQKLKEFSVLCSRRSFLIPLTVAEHANTIRSLTTLKMNIEKVIVEELKLLMDFVMSLPSLSTLDFCATDHLHNFGDQVIHHSILGIANCHLERFGTLKKVSTTKIHFQAELLGYSLLMSAISRNLDVDLTEVGNVDLSLEKFITYASLSGHSIPRRGNEYFSIKKGKITLRGDGLANGFSILGNFINLESLDITIRGIGQVGMPCLDNLRKLQVLVLRGDKPNFCCHVPTLKKLTISEDFLSYPNFGQYVSSFPNLEEVRLESLNLVPCNFIYSLSTLLKLANLELYKCKFTDFDLIQVVDPIWYVSDKPSDEKVPAIAAFKSLKKLSIFECSRLTDSCLTNGVIHIKTLQSLTVTWNPGTFTSRGMQQFGDLWYSKGGTVLNIDDSVAPYKMLSTKIEPSNK